LPINSYLQSVFSGLLSQNTSFHREKRADFVPNLVAPDQFEFSNDSDAEDDFDTGSQDEEFNPLRHIDEE